MKETFFSIVITAYNCEKYIEKCIFSVLNQNFREYELIIIDDCSSDNTLKIIENIKDNRIKIFSLPQNQGVSNARNTAIKASNGEYIFFLDCDDYIENNLLKEAYNELLSSKADVLFCPYFVFWENKNKYKFSNPQYRMDKIKKLPRPFDKENAKNIIYETNYEVCTKFYKRSFLLDNNICFKTLLFGEDLPFYWEIIQKAQKFSYLEKQYYCYRKGHKCLDVQKIVEYLPHALELSREYMPKEGGIFYKKSAKMLNFWLIKTNFNAELYDFAVNFCKNEKILNINSPFLRLKYKILLKLFGKI